MNADEKLFARNMFRLRVHEAKGTAFQELFKKVMQYRNPEFTEVKPHGNLGDRSNDGYIRPEGHYFQVYAPENPAGKPAAVAAATKAERDFAGLLSYWNKSTPVKRYSFVFNDEYRGSPPQLEEALARIQKNHGVLAGVFLAKDLEHEALSLPQDQLLDVIGAPVPEPGAFDSVDFGILGEVIRHVMQHTHPLIAEGILTAPDFDEKIKFNGLSRPVAALLNFGSFQNEVVIDYFSKNSTFARQQLRDHLNSLYDKSRRHLVDRGGEPALLGDLVFFDLLDKMTPRSDRRLISAVQQAAIVVMSYYFEACDVFEEPDASP